MNDLWLYNLKNCVWSELSVENRSNFRPRTNFTATLHKNTIYIFGGFINLQNYKSTDELTTISLFESKPHHPEVEAKPQPKQLIMCAMCKFDNLPQVVPAALK